jgi:hypothetical protein
MKAFAKLLPHPHCPCVLLPMLMLMVGAGVARADTIIASYEADETGLSVTPGWSDAGLTVSAVVGGVDGAPVATHGNRVLKLDFAGEDGKVEVRHQWNGVAYDLAGVLELRVDVYIATDDALPGLMGIWSPDWAPPDAWQIGLNPPAATNVWTTVSFDVSGREQVGLDEIRALVLEQMPGSDGVVYLDSLRLHGPQHVAPPRELAGVAFANRNELVWRPADDTTQSGFHVYRATMPNGPYTRITSAPLTTPGFTDLVGENPPVYFYRVTAIAGEYESAMTTFFPARFNGKSDVEMLDLVEHAAFRYFWEYAHPACGATREGYLHWDEIVATGGSGMGLMVMVVGAERGYITRTQAADRVRQVLAFFEDDTTRYHGAWAHWINGSTGETIPFSEFDDGGDLVETAYFAQGLLTVRQYFDGTGDVETEIRTRATRMYEDIDWDWYRRYPDSPWLYWHWSPNHEWEMNMPIGGYNETMITYIMAAASPTHGIPGYCYHDGWAGGYYANGGEFYGYKEWVGPDLGGPLFFTHYSAMGFDPRYVRDNFCNYFDNARNISLIHQAYCADNPNDFAGYNKFLWGLTASSSPPPWYYWFHCPTNDNGTIAPTCALSATPYTPRESIATMRYLYDTHGAGLWGPYGFLDALNPTENWYSGNYIAIDQGPIVVMIENYRSQLCWDLFMSNPEIKPALLAMGWTYDGDLTLDHNVNLQDFLAYGHCLGGPGHVWSGGCLRADLDDDQDGDMRDFARFQAAFMGP